VKRSRFVQQHPQGINAHHGALRTSGQPGLDKILCRKCGTAGHPHTFANVRRLLHGFWEDVQTV
jgi:hypothetical protein